MSPTKEAPKISDSELKSTILSIIKSSHSTKFEETSAAIARLFGRSRKLQSIVDVKQLSSKVLRQLREDLAASHTTYIKRVNADLIEFESSQRSNNAAMRQMPNEELIKMINSLKQEILSLRLNEIFMKKCSTQINATKQAVQICNIDCIFSNYQDLDKDQQLPQKLVKVMDEMAD